jgi:hypothetical protein
MNGLPARAAAALALVLGLLTSAAPTVGSCLMPVPMDQATALRQGIQEADSVFVGTVASLSNNDRWASVAVEEVWKGPDLSPLVEVRGGPDGNAASSVDRAFTAKTSYLFVVFISDGVLSDNSCSATTEFTRDLIALRPATARQPVTTGPDPDSAAPFDPASLLLPAALIIGAGVLVFGGALVLRRKS